MDAVAESWAHIARESNYDPFIGIPEVLVVIPTIEGRQDLLRRAMLSIRGEEVPFALAVETDTKRLGPAAVRNSAVARGVEVYGMPKYVAFLDDDDEFQPGHLTRLVRHAEATGADVVYPWFDLNVGGVINNSKDPLAMNGQPVLGQSFDPAALDTGNFIPVTALVRTGKFTEVGGFPRPGSPEWPHADCEDWALWRRLRDAGARFEHLPERTWTWHWHGRNTSGRPDNARKIYG